MNASQTKFNQSQSQMRRTNQSNPGEFGGTNLGNLTQTGNNFGATNSSNAATLKGKLASLEEQIQLVADEMNTHKKDVVSLKNEKDTLQEILKMKTHEVKNTLLQELNKVEDEMKRHFSKFKITTTNYKFKSGKNCSSKSINCFAEKNF